MRASGFTGVEKAQNLSRRKKNAMLSNKKYFEKWVSLASNREHLYHSSRNQFLRIGEGKQKGLTE